MKGDNECSIYLPYVTGSFFVLMYMYILFLTAVSMAIINLLIKPFTSFVLFKIYQHRGGSYGDLNIPGVPNFAGVSHVQVVH